MRELSMHIMDLVQNSISAKAIQIKIKVEIQTKNDQLIIEIIDNGTGIPQDILLNVTNPFYTGRSTRKVGLGLSLTKAAAENCDGKLEIESEINKGTIVRVNFKNSHIDRAPLGNMKDTLISLIAANPDIDFIYIYKVDDREFTLDTQEVKKHIEGVPINDINILNWLDEYIEEGIGG